MLKDCADNSWIANDYDFGWHNVWHKKFNQTMKWCFMHSKVW